MDDKQIIELYWIRDEQAIQASMDVYGLYCRKVAQSILEDPADVEETVADTWMKAWNAIPPEKPTHLRLFLGKITRNLALSAWRKQNACCRGGGQVALALEELGECISPGDSPETVVSMKELENAITQFLHTVSARQRAVFLRRYFYLEDIATISKRFGVKEANVGMILSRTRQKLKKYLIQEGYLL